MAVCQGKAFCTTANQVSLPKKEKIALCEVRFPLSPPTIRVVLLIDYLAQVSVMTFHFSPSYVFFISKRDFSLHFSIKSVIILPVLKKLSFLMVLLCLS
jgi:hypothetical protein